MTLFELLTEMARQYPTTVEVNTCVAFLNQAIVEMEKYFDNYAVANFTTTADVDEYSLPTGIEDVSQIVSIGISTKATPANRYDYTKYYPSQFKDYPQNGNSYFQLTDTDGDKKLIIYPIPHATGLTVNCTYRKHFVQLFYPTDAAVSPEFDSRYHILLVYYANHMIASMGHAPDTLQADMFMQKWLDGIKELVELKSRRDMMHPQKRKDNKQWHNGKKHVAGTTVPVVEE